MTIINKGKLYKTVGWLTVGAGLYLITVGHFLDGEDIAYFNPTPDDDNIIEAEWFEVTD